MSLNDNLMDEYEQFCFSVDLSQNTKEHAYHGLIAEVGELAALFQKNHRGDYDYVDQEKLKAELGDIMWYLTRLINEFGYTSQEIKEFNSAKLRARVLNETIKGNGDDR